MVGIFSHQITLAVKGEDIVEYTETLETIFLNEPPALPIFVPKLKPQTPTVRLGHKGAEQLLETLAVQKIIDKNGRITASGREQIENNRLLLPEVYQPIAISILDQMRRADTKIPVRDASKEVVVRRKKEALLSPAFNEIWNRIRQKTRYRVKMDREQFIEYAAAHILLMPPIQKTRIVETTAMINVQKTGVAAIETHSRAVAVEHDSSPLPDVLAILRNELHLRKSTLFEIFKCSGRMKDFLNNPERFIEEAVIILRDCMAEMILDGVRYQKILGAEYSVQEVFDKEELLASLDYNAVPVEHSVYDHIVTDSIGVEGRFAKALDDDPDVRLFFKLPEKFKIDTPLGTYNPDWAVLLSVDGTERLYFVLETKGTTRELGRRGDENIKIECGRRHFEALGTASYGVTTDWKRFKLSI